MKSSASSRKIGPESLPDFAHAHMTFAVEDRWKDHLDKRAREDAKKQNEGKRFSLIRDFDEFDLSNKTVIICPDSDVIGNRQVRDAEAMMTETLATHSKAKAVKSITLPENPVVDVPFNEQTQEGDVHFKMGLDDYLLRHGAEKALELRANAKKRERHTIWKMEEIQNAEAIDFLEGRFEKNAINLIVGMPGVGKTRMLLDLVCSALRGERSVFGDVRPIEGNVVLVSSETDAATRIGPYLDARGIDRFRFRVVPFPAELRSVRDLKEVMKRCRCEYFIIDPLSDALGGANMNYSDEMRDYLSELSEMCRHYGETGLVVAHLSKKSDLDLLHQIAGAHGIGAYMRDITLLTGDPNGRANHFAVARLKGSYRDASKDQNIIYRHVAHRCEFVSPTELTTEQLFMTAKKSGEAAARTKPAGSVELTKKQLAALAIIECVDSSPLTVRKSLEALFSHKTYSDALKWLKQQNVVTRNDGDERFRKGINFAEGKRRVCEM